MRGGHGASLGDVGGIITQGFTSHLFYINTCIRICICYSYTCFSLDEEIHQSFLQPGTLIDASVFARIQLKPRMEGGSAADMLLCINGCFLATHDP